MKEEQYKFQVGDKVRFTRSKPRYEECDKCGHSETFYEEEEVTEIIEARKYELVYHVANGFMTETTTTDDGMTIHRPYMASPKVLDTEPVYKIDGSWWPEPSLSSINA